MSFLVSEKVIGECTSIKFDVLGKSYCNSIRDASEYVRGLLLATKEPASLSFTDIVACRAIVLQKSEGPLCQEQAIWNSKGPFTGEETLNMMEFPPRILNREWGNYMEKFARTIENST